MHSRQAGMINDQYEQHVETYKRRHATLEAVIIQVERVVLVVCQAQAEMATLLKSSCENLVAVCRGELNQIKDELRYLPIDAINLHLRLCSPFPGAATNITPKFTAISATVAGRTLTGLVAFRGLSVPIASVCRRPTTPLRRR